MAYAEKTKVPVSKSKADIENLVKKYGANGWGIMEFNGRVQIAFQLAGRNLLFRVAIPEKDQAQRSMYRALLLVIKGKLESAESGIETLEEAFMANIVMPGGETVADSILPSIAKAYESGRDIPLLPGH